MNPIALIYRVVHPAFVLWWSIRRPRINASAALIERSGKILLIRRTYGRRELWYLPGGLASRGEDPGAAAVREAIEETGLVLHGTKHLTTERFEEDHRQVTLHVFRGRGFGTLKIDPHEIAEARWFEPNHLPVEIAPSTGLAVTAAQKAGVL